jgi:anti-sigma B factor antagonist
MESNSPSAQKPDRDAPTVLPLKGEIDLHVFPEITASLDAVIEKKPKHVVVDVSGVTYIDSAGLAALILAMQKVEAYGGQFSLAGVQTTVRSILKMSRLDDVFQILPDTGAALTYQASDNSTRTRERLSFTVRSTV